MQFVENSKKALEALERKNIKQSQSNQVIQHNLKYIGLIIILPWSGLGSGEERLHHNGGCGLLIIMTKIISIDCNIVPFLMKK